MPPAAKKKLTEAIATGVTIRQPAVPEALTTSTMRLLAARTLPQWHLEAWAYVVWVGDAKVTHWFLFAHRTDRGSTDAVPYFRYTCRDKKHLQATYAETWPMGRTGWVRCTANGSFNSVQYPEYRMQQARLDFQKRQFKER